MLKNINKKIILFFIILSILVLFIVYIFNLYQIKELNNILETTTNYEEQKNIIANYANLFKDYNIKISIGLAVIIILFGVIISRTALRPIERIIKSAENFRKNDGRRIKFLSDGAKNEDDIDEFALILSEMTDKLQDNLNEVSRQKNQMETILLHMNDGVIAFDLDGNIIHINLAAKEFLGLDNNTKTFNDVFSNYNDINMERLIYLENWTSSSKTINVEDRTYNLFFAPYKNEDERPNGIIVVIQDVTEHMKLDVMRKQFVADVSHELKTPITSILGYSQTLQENEVDDETREKFLGRISSEAERMSALVSDLLILSRYDTAKIQAEKQEFDLGEVVKDVFESQQFEMEKKNLTGECLVTANVPSVYADKVGIQRVVLNIINNAIKYTPDGGSVNVYVGFVYTDAYIKVIDTGIGIPEDEIPRIFERFYRVDKARTREMGGTGLGLSIVKEILKQNNGRIDVKSEVDKGTEVVIRIPTKQSSEKNAQKEKVEE